MEKDTANSNGTPLLINFPQVLRKYPYWSVCGTPLDKLDDEDPTQKAPLDVNTGYGSWDCLFPSPEAAYEAMLKTKHAFCIGFIIPPEPIIEDGKILLCGDFDFKNPDIQVHPDVPRHNDGAKLSDFVVSCSTYSEFSKSKKGYHVWMFAEIPVPEKPIPDTFGVGIFYKRHNIVFTGDIIPGSQADIHTIPINVLMKINLWSKGPNALKTSSTIGMGDSKFELPDKILDGSKHNCFRDLALSLANRGMSVPELMFACQAMNENGRVIPPVSQADMDTKVKALCETAVRKVAKEKAERTLNPEYKDLYKYVLVASGDGFKEKLTLNHDNIVEWLHNKHHTISFKNDLYTYENGIYVENSNLCENELRIFLKAIKMEGPVMGVIHEIIGRLKIYEPFREYPFNRKSGILPVSNGILEFDFDNGKVELKPHSHEYLFTLQLPVVYDEKASGEVFRENVLGKYVDSDKLCVLYMIPAMAILQLVKHRVYKKSLICEGEGNSGKTTYLEWLLSLFSLKYCASISLHEIAEDRFAFAQLENKILNNYDELSDMQLKEIEKFKKLTGRQDHKIEKKGKDGYDTILTAMHVFATNRPPTVNDNILYDNAFWNRWIYLHFDNVFDVDMKFKDTWFTEENISGSFNDVIQMVLDIERNGLPFISDPSEVKDEWMTHADSLLKFIEDNMIDSPTMNFFSKDQLYNSYRSYCDEQEIPPRKVPSDITKFTQLLFKHGFSTHQLPKKKECLLRPYVYRAAKIWKDTSAYKPPAGFDLYNPDQKNIT